MFVYLQRRKIANHMRKNNIYKAIIYLFICLLWHNNLNSQSSKGTDFWVTFFPNLYADVDNLTLVAIGENNCTGVVTNPQTGWSSSFSISSGNATTIIIPISQAYDYNASDCVINKALHITTTDSIMLYANNFEDFSLDVTNVLPTHFLGSNYVIQTYKGHSSFSVIATEDNTTINIELKGNSINNNANTPFSTTLNAGQCYQVLSGIDVDLSGSTISSNDNKKIAVFAGNAGNRVPFEIEGRDHMMEQMIPTSYWGNKFIITNSMSRSKDRIRITSLNDSCQIKKDGIVITNLNARQTYEFEITSNDPVAYIETSEPASVFLYITGAWYGGINGDPSMVVIPPIDQKIKNVIFSTIFTNVSQNHFVNIVTKTSNASNMRLNGNSISSNFNIIPSLPDFSYARIPIAQGTYTLNNITSTEDNGFIAHIYGFRDWESYAYSICSVVINPPDSSNSIQLTVNGLNTEDYPNGFKICNNNDTNFTFDLNIDYIPSNVIWNFGDETTGTGFPITHQYDEPGIYNVLCMIYKMNNETEYLDTILTTLLSIHSSYDTTINASICAGDTYNDNGFNESKTGIYIDSLQAIDGCDSIIRLNLTVHPTYNDTIFATICEGEVYDYFGFYEEETTITTKHFQTTFGCDSSITLNLKVGRIYNDTIYDTIVEGGCYNKFGFYECNEGFYSLDYTSLSGCDSSLHLSLYIIPETDLYVENCITPKSPTNNKFEIKHSESLIIDDVYIYNRAGELVFNSQNNTETWDGKYKGQYCPQAVYTYIIYYHIKGAIGRSASKTGTVLLLY